MSTRKFQVGDLFTVDPALYPAQCHGVVYRVESLPKGANGVNYKGLPVDGSGRGVRAPEYAMRPHDPNEQQQERPKYLPLPEIAAVVRVNGVRGINPSDLYVVTGYPSNRMNAVRLMRLGGEGGRYWKAIPVSALEVVDPDRIVVKD